MGKRIWLRRALSSVGVFLILASCGLWSQTLPATLPEVQEGTVPQVSVMPPLTTLLPTSPTPEPPSPSPPPCVPIPPQPPEQISWTFAALRRGVGLAALNAGLTPEALNARLQESGLGGYPRAVYTGDLNGDGEADALLVLVDPTSEARPPAGALLVALKGQGGYCLAQVLDAPDSRFAALVVHAVEDLNADGRVEAVVGWVHCEEMTCTERLQVLAWRNHEFTNRLREDLEVSDPWVEILPNEAGEGYRVAVHTQGVPGGTGPARGYTLLYGYNAAADAWNLMATRWEPPKVRIHLLHDADRAARQGNEMQALLLYGQVVASQEVRDEALPRAGEPARLHAILAAYARFRMLALHARAGRQAMAQATYAELRQAVDDDPALMPYFEMASVFWETYQTKGWAAACQAARDYARAHADAVLAPLGPQVYGTNNPAYTPEDVCALETENP